MDVVCGCLSFLVIILTVLFCVFLSLHFLDETKQNPFFDQIYYVIKAFNSNHIIIIIIISGLRGDRHQNVKVSRSTETVSGVSNRTSVFFVWRPDSE